MIPSKSVKFTFNDLDDFTIKSIEELCTYEELFKNQTFIETYNDIVQKNKENLQKIFLSSAELQCNQKFLENGLNLLEFKLQELDRGITCFENNCQSPEYLTPKDTARIDLYNLFLCIRTQITNIEEIVEEINSEVKEMKKNINGNPIEKLAQVMLKHLNLLEGIDTKIMWMKEQVQHILFSEMIVMKRFNLKLKPC